MNWHALWWVLSRSAVLIAAVVVTCISLDAWQRNSPTVRRALHAVGLISEDDMREGS